MKVKFSNDIITISLESGEFVQISELEKKLQIKHFDPNSNSKFFETKKYQFKELSKEIQEEILDKNRYWNVSDNWWYEDELDLRKQDFDFGNGKSGITFDEFYFDICLGNSGPAITGIKGLEIDKEIVIANIEKNQCADFKKKYSRFFIPQINDLWNIVANNPSGHYAFTKGHLEIEIRSGKFNDYPYPTGKRQQEFEEYIIDYVWNHLTMILKDLVEDYYYQISDEAIIDTIEANECEFDIDGGMI
jgi:hypothetical protein